MILFQIHELNNEVIRSSEVVRNVPQHFFLYPGECSLCAEWLQIKFL